MKNVGARLNRDDERKMRLGGDRIFSLPVIQGLGTVRYRVRDRSYTRITASRHLVVLAEFQYCRPTSHSAIKEIVSALNDENSANSFESMRNRQVGDRLGKISILPLVLIILSNLIVQR